MHLVDLGFQGRENYDFFLRLCQLHEKEVGVEIKVPV